MIQRTLDSLLGFSKLIYAWYARRQKRSSWRWVKWIASSVILMSSIWFIWKNLSSGYDRISTTGLDLDIGSLLISWFCVTLCVFLGAWIWAMLIKAFGGQIDITCGIQVHLISNLAKYVPGFVWSYASKTYLTTRQGVPTHIALLGLVGEFIILFNTGIVLLLLLLPYSGLVKWSTLSVLLFQGGVFSLTIASILGIPNIGRNLAQKLAVHWPKISLSETNWQQVTIAFIVMILTWCLLGLGFSLLSPIQSFTWTTMAKKTFALVLALLVGQIILFSPMGIGVREAIFVALLNSLHSAPTILTIALILRMEILIGELVSALIMILITKIRHRPANNTKG